MSHDALIPAGAPRCKEPAPGTAPDDMRAIWWGTITVLAVSLAWGLLFDVHHGPVLCPSRWLMDAPCPGCGLTRSFVTLAHLDVVRAFSLHPLGPLLFFWTLTVALHGAIERIFARRLRTRALRSVFFGLTLSVLLAVLVHGVLHFAHQNF